MATFTGGQLRTIRTFKGIKQTLAARNLRISQPAYCKLEQLPLIKEHRWVALMKALNICENEWKSLLSLYPPRLTPDTL